MSPNPRSSNPWSSVPGSNDPGSGPWSCRRRCRSAPRGGCRRQDSATPRHRGVFSRTPPPHPPRRHSTALAAILSRLLSDSASFWLQQRHMCPSFEKHFFRIEHRGIYELLLGTWHRGPLPRLPTHVCLQPPPRLPRPFLFRPRGGVPPPPELRHRGIVKRIHRLKRSLDQLSEGPDSCWGGTPGEGGPAPSFRRYRYIRTI